jgi:hypothetical protein
MVKSQRLFCVPSRPIALLLVLVVAALCSCPERVRANVYATSIKLNNAFTNAVVGPPTSTNVVISYVLNETASAGVTVQIKLGPATIRTFTFPPGSSTNILKGTNSLTWNLLDDNSNAVYNGTYTVSISAASTGYTNWTQISDDTNQANKIFEGRGIAVNKNTNSIYYGRIFIGNAQDGDNADIEPLERVGIHKVNADGSFADEGGYSDGGYDWAHGSINDDYSPWKLEVGADDRVYANDFYLLPGVVLSFDPTISSNSLKTVLGPSNYTNSQSQLSGMTVSGTATNLQLWMADATSGGMGIRRWDITASGTVASNDYGVTVVQAGGGSDLDQFPEDVAIDASNRIYVLQRRESPDDSSMRLFRFPPYAGSPETIADWKIGTNDDTMTGGYGVAVDPSGTYVACAFNGFFPSGPNGATRVFASTNGDPIVTLTPETIPSHGHWDVAWDNVGNLYTIDNYDSIWRIYSPPGTNQAATVAVPLIQVGGVPPPPAPFLGPPTYSSGILNFTLFGQPNATYIIQQSGDLQNWTSIQTNFASTANRPVSISSSVARQFFRAKVGP